MKKTTIGGQALIEGIMMKGPDKTVLAVRYTDGTIRSEPVLENGWAKKHKILRLPVLRGVVGFINSMITGYKSLMRSADLSGMTELEEQQEAEKKAKKAAKKAGTPANEPAAGTEPDAKAEFGAGTEQGASPAPAAALKINPEQAQSVEPAAEPEPVTGPEQAHLAQAGPEPASFEPKSSEQAHLEQAELEHSELEQPGLEQSLEQTARTFRPIPPSLHGAFPA